MLEITRTRVSKTVAELLAEFKVRMCAESQRSAKAMSDKLETIQQDLEDFHIMSKTLQKLSNVDDTLTKVNSEITKLSKTIAEIECALMKPENADSLIPQILDLILADGRATREQLKESTATVVHRLDNVNAILMLKESVIRVKAETFPGSNGLTWYDDANRRRKVRIWSLDTKNDGFTEPEPQASINGLALSSTRLEDTYNKIMTIPRIADEINEKINVKKQDRWNSISPYLGLAKRGQFLEQLHEYVRGSILHQFEEFSPLEIELKH